MGVGDTTNFQQKSYHSFFVLGVGCKPSAKWVHVEGLRFADTLGVAEVNEASHSMISPATTHTHATKRQMAIEQLDDCIINNKAS